jgi:hypothetical protein
VLDQCGALVSVLGVCFGALAVWLTAPAAAAPLSGSALGQAQPAVSLLTRARVDQRKRRSGRTRQPAPPKEEPAAERQQNSERGKVTREKTAPAAPPRDDAEPSRAPAAAAEPKAFDAAPQMAQAWSQDEIIAALQDCVRSVGPITGEVEPLAPLRAGECGAAAPVAVSALASAPRVELRPSATVNCGMAGRLYRWIEEVVQPAARELLGSPVVGITNLSGYQCRNRNGGRDAFAKMSEHAFANAIDIGGFELADGRRVEVLAHWGATERDLQEARRREAEAEAGGANRTRGGDQAPARDKAATAEDDAVRPRDPRDRAGGFEPKAPNARTQPQERKRPTPGPPERSDNAGRTSFGAAMAAQGRGADEPSTKDLIARQTTPEARFLRRLHSGACSRFGTALGPEANEAHRDHLHLDLAPRKRTAFCE